MKNTFNWKKELLSNNYELYSENKSVGSLTSNVFSQTTKGAINDEIISFKTKGVINPETLIVSHSDGNILGGITYDTLKSTATININETKTSWKYTDFFQTKWELSTEKGVLTKYSSAITSGTISSEINNKLIVLSGLYVATHFNRKNGVIALIPVFAALMTVFLL